MLQQCGADWLAVALGICAGKALGRIPPPAKHFDCKDPSLSYPYIAKETVSKPCVIAGSILVPLIVFSVIGCIRGNFALAHHAMLGLMVSNTLTYILVSTCKAFAGRHRPDWLARCAIAEPPRILIDGQRSFMSGHAGASFSAATYISLFLSSQLDMLDSPQAYKSFTVLIPLLAALVISFTRITDHRHHPSDVIAGSISGILLALLSYLQFSHN